MDDILTVSLAGITPHNLASDSAIAPVITALDPQLQALSRDSYIPLILPETGRLNDDTLAHLAVQFHADFYDLAAGHDAKLSAITSSLTWHMRKGTPSAIIEALRTLGVEAEFIPWWVTGDAPYTFRIKADITGDFYMSLGKDRITHLITRAVNEAKSARSLMAGLDTRLYFSQSLDIHAAPIFALESSEHSRLILPEKNITFPANAAVLIHKSGILPVDLDRIREVKLHAYSANIFSENFDSTLGVDLDTMQELLEQFTSRIFARIDRLEDRLNAKIDLRTGELDVKIDAVIEQLRWKGPDEDL